MVKKYLVTNLLHRGFEHLSVIQSDSIDVVESIHENNIGSYSAKGVHNDNDYEVTDNESGETGASNVKIGEEYDIPEDTYTPVPQREIQHRFKCLLCPTWSPKIYRCWKKCKNEGCLQYLCRKCHRRLNIIKVGTYCICCGYLYNRGPTKKIKKCRTCGFWRCGSCRRVKCRCILRTTISQHNF